MISVVKQEGAAARIECGSFFVQAAEPKPGLARGLGDRLQSRNVPPGTSGDCLYSGFSGKEPERNKFQNKQYITVDNSYILLYTVNQEEDKNEDYNQQFIDGTDL